MNKPKIAITHDWIYGGGAEKVVQSLHELYPEAPIYTSYCSPEWRKKLDGKVITGYLQHWPFSKLRRSLPLLRQRWFSKLDLSEYDIIISSSGNGEAKFAQKTRDDQLHICYCHTPTHFYWRYYRQYSERPSFRPYWLARLGLKTLVKPLRKNDWEAAQKIDEIIANSSGIQADISKFYNRDSTIIFPPVNTEYFSEVAKNRTSKTKIPEKPRCIIWGRLVPFKRVDLAIEACNKLGWELDILGSGPDRERLESLAGPTVHLRGFVSDEDRQKYIKDADLFIFCSREDFGLAPVESIAAGLPVVAYQAGGALDYIKPNENGWFFNKQEPNSLIETLKNTVNKPVDASKISHTSSPFTIETFKKNAAQFIEEAWKNHENSN